MSNTERAFTATSFQAFLEEGYLMGSRCAETGEVFVPPRPMCPRTHSSRMEWVRLSGRAVLMTFTSIYIGTSAMIAAGYDREQPYCSGIVELLEGPRMSAQIVGVNPLRPDDIKLGLELRAVFLEGVEGSSSHRLAFTPV